MKVLGIDPGTAACGYGIVQGSDGRLRAVVSGCWRTSAREPLDARLLTIFEGVRELFAAHEPDAVALEALYFGQNVATAFAVGQARGAILVAAGERGIPCSDYTPQQVKGAVCGSGRAPKDQVQRMVQTLLRLPEPPRPDHAADALAVAICHANGAPLRAAVAAAPAIGGPA